jgi:predicted RNA-binding Zn-ribbon protein involved in translation (DUF1610 family)
MNDEILKRLEGRLDRRSFLRGSSLTAAALVGIAAASPLVVFAQTQEKPREDKKKDDAEQKDDPNGGAKPDQPDASSERGSTTETKLDADGTEFRECPQCGHNMYRQGRTWTCENCGYSYIE